MDDNVDFDKALAVIENAKIQCPSACNLLETLLVNFHIAEEFLLALSAMMAVVYVNASTSFTDGGQFGLG